MNRKRKGLEEKQTDKKREKITYFFSKSKIENATVSEESFIKCVDNANEEKSLTNKPTYGRNESNSGN